MRKHGFCTIMGLVILIAAYAGAQDKYYAAEEWFSGDSGKTFISHTHKRIRLIITDKLFVVCSPKSMTYTLLTPMLPANDSTSCCLAIDDTGRRCAFNMTETSRSVLAIIKYDDKRTFAYRIVKDN